mmetsp:Transcript_44050/g.99192  ORF Transcript_44050/g.99192 Transcript_44050/m.99192 type:complete len:591 (+) Transcript_44050:32-1804(+)
MAHKVRQDRPTQPPRPLKAYKNPSFLNGAHARTLRILCEFEEPRVRLHTMGVEHIVMLFGSARAKSSKDYQKALLELREQAKRDASLTPQLQRMERLSFLSKYYEETVKLAGLITEFSAQRKKEGKPTYTIGTGAGPGMMEAANEGAWRAGGESVGFGISLPFEKGLNPFVTPELGFEFHYFFTRKFWMAYKCMGLVVAPGGFGTCDELFEILSLMRTGKIKQRLPVILFGSQYWQDVLDVKAMEQHGLVGADELNDLFSCDTAEAAFSHLKEYWERVEKEGALPSSPQPKPIREDTLDQPALKKQRQDAPAPTERPMPGKAYKNLGFIKGQESRMFRIQCEFEDAARRLAQVQHVCLCIGSGKLRSYASHVAALAEVVKDPSRAGEAALLARQQPLLKLNEVSRDLARKITAWSMEREPDGHDTYTVGTGGGPGVMEAANEGAWEAGGQSCAFSTGVFGDDANFNRYVTPELAFVFNYFFTRKFWMTYKCMGMVAFPGGFGTCDELFEVLTLMQTGKIRRKIPVVLVGKDYWQAAIKWKKMAEYGMIAEADVDQILFTDSAEEAFTHLTTVWERLEGEGALPPKKKAVE